MTENAAAGPPSFAVKCLTAFVSVALALPVSMAGGGLFGLVLFWLIEPDCSSGDWLCGLGEVLIAFTVAAAVAFMSYVWLARALVARMLPDGHRSGTYLVVVLTPLAVLFLAWISIVS